MACSCGAFDCRRQTRIFPLRLPTRPCRRGPAGVTGPWTLKLRCIPFCREEIRRFGDPWKGEGLGSRAAGWSRPLVPPSGLQMALVLGMPCWSCAGEGSPQPPGLRGFIPGSARHRDAAPRHNPRLTQSSWPDGAKKLSWAPASVGHCHQGSCTCS